jgi:hypothetical protein
MTWRELGEAIENMEPRFLDTEIQLYDATEGITYHDNVELMEDETHDDYTIDLNQPQIWFNMDETTEEL